MEKLIISNADEKKALLKRIRERMDLVKRRRNWASDLYNDMDQSFNWQGEYDALYHVYSWIDKDTSVIEGLDDDAWHEIQNSPENCKELKHGKIIKLIDSPCSGCSFDGDDEEYFEQIEYDDNIGNPTIWKCRHCGQVMHNLGEK